jgi:uncharacterized protein YjbI with pentapeptide repeats
MDTNELLNRYAEGERIFHDISLTEGSTDLQGRNLSGIEIRRSEFEDVNLEGANLEEAILQEISFFEAVICRAARTISIS